MPTYEPFDWYETPVYYDIIYDVDTKKDATFLEECYVQHASDTEVDEKLNILEPACGTGRLMAELAGRGHQVAGVDLSKGMLDFARNRFKEKNVKGKLIQAPMQDFDLRDFTKKHQGFDLAHILVSSFKYLQAEQVAADCLNCIADHLRVGGVFVLGIHLTDPDDNNRYLERWRAKRDNLDVICTVRTNPPDHTVVAPRRPGEAMTHEQRVDRACPTPRPAVAQDPIAAAVVPGHDLVQINRNRDAFGRWGWRC